MLSCISPHICEEIWQILGHDNTIAYESWPTWDESKLKDTEVTMAVQVNGKMRGTFTIAADSSDEDCVAAAQAEEKVAKFIAGLPGQLRKTIVVKNKLVNLIIK